MSLIEKTKTDEGVYEIRLNGRLMFSAMNNETIKIMGEMLQDLAAADDYATMVTG